VITGKVGGFCVYSQAVQRYYVNSSGEYALLVAAILAAPWVPRAEDKFRVNVGIYEPASGNYAVGTYTIDRYELSGVFGQLFKDGGRISRYAGFGIAITDAFLWLRGALSGVFRIGGAALSPAYLLICLLVGVLLYGFGLLMEYVFYRLYGYTPPTKVVEA
jgi:hypothetical protein